MAQKSQKLRWVEAAIRAWQAVFEHAGVKGLDVPVPLGKRVVVDAAASRVGRLACAIGLDRGVGSCGAGWQCGNRRFRWRFRCVGDCELSR